VRDILSCGIFPSVANRRRVVNHRHSTANLLRFVVCGNYFSRACELLPRSDASAVCRLLIQVHHSLPRSAESCECVHHCSFLCSLWRSPLAGVSRGRRPSVGRVPHLHQYRPCRLRRILRPSQATGLPRSAGRRPMPPPAQLPAHGPATRRLPAINLPVRSPRAAATLLAVPAREAVQAPRRP